MVVLPGGRFRHVRASHEAQQRRQEGTLHGGPLVASCTMDGSPRDLELLSVGQVHLEPVLGIW